MEGVEGEVCEGWLYYSCSHTLLPHSNSDDIPDNDDLLGLLSEHVVRQAEKTGARKAAIVSSLVIDQYRCIGLVYTDHKSSRALFRKSNSQRSYSLRYHTGNGSTCR